VSKNGELIPEWADKLRCVAAAIGDKTVDRADAYLLRQLATFLDGSHRAGELRFHSKKGRRHGGSLSVMRKLEMAKAIKAYRDTNGPPLDKAFQDANIQAQFLAGEDTLRSAWKEMSPYFRIDEGARDLWLHFRKLEADHPGSVSITRKGK